MILFNFYTPNFTHTARFISLPFHFGHSIMRETPYVFETLLFIFFAFFYPFDYWCFWLFYDSPTPKPLPISLQRAKMGASWQPRFECDQVVEPHWLPIMSNLWPPSRSESERLGGRLPGHRHTTPQTHTFQRALCLHGNTELCPAKPSALSTRGGSLRLRPCLDSFALPALEYGNSKAATCWTPLVVSDDCYYNFCFILKDTTSQKFGRTHWIE